MTMHIIYGILWFVTIAVAAGIAGIWKKVKDDEGLSDVFGYIGDYCEIAVRYAKDIGDNQGLTGEERLKLAIAAVKDMREISDIDISDAQIEVLVRAAYTIMIDEGQEPVYLVGTNEDIVDGE